MGVRDESQPASVGRRVQDRRCREPGKAGEGRGDVLPWLAQGRNRL